VLDAPAFVLLHEAKSAPDARVYPLVVNLA
jgi:hypothetical protein